MPVKCMNKEGGEGVDFLLEYVIIIVDMVHN